jgi:hypothetical protein
MQTSPRWDGVSWDEHEWEIETLNGIVDFVFVIRQLEVWWEDDEEIRGVCALDYGLQIGRQWGMNGIAVYIGSKTK